MSCSKCEETEKDLANLKKLLAVIVDDVLGGGESEWAKRILNDYSKFDPTLSKLFGSW
jgi:hypothetical protein